jgi:beta-glucanase (GH16 family)
MRRLFFVLFALFFLATAAPAQNWKLMWSDEFDGPANTPPDPAKWGYATGSTGWGNNEWENYTNAVENAFLDGKSNLVIRAIQTNPEGGRAAYTSARLLTRSKFTFTYGKVEARIKIPFGQGIWPAFWMLGAEGRWPANGEIDVMENIGKEPSMVHGTIHGPGYSGGNGIGAPYSLPKGQKFSDDFHTFAVVWAPDSIEFFVDGHSYQKVLASTVTAKGNNWVYTQPFYLLLNLAVGGNWPGYPDATTQFPQTMTVDYVRVYHDDSAAK